MSAESAFAPLSFPSLPGQGSGQRDAIRGHATGYAAGRKQAEAEAAALRAALQAESDRALEVARDNVASALEALARAAADYQARQVPVLQSVDASMAAAALELAEAIVGRELATGDGSARAALERASGDAVPVGSVVRLNPQDIAVITAGETTWAGLELVPDSSLDRGDAVVELQHGSLDARVSASLQRARTALSEAAG
jgi:flagellar assembly protein FliH